MSKQYQERFLREQIRDYDQLLRDHSGETSRNIIKTIEKQKARREERLKELAAEGKKDDGLVFDELGVDHVFVDEAHYFKNLETPTKMERVAGIQTGGSERAFDLYMKARYLGEQHPGHGVTFATGTPISNTMVELYTLCGRPHKVYYVVFLFMWRLTSIAYFQSDWTPIERHITDLGYNVRRKSISPLTSFQGVASFSPATSQLASALAFISRSTSA
jgi:hypothetical protein